MQERQRQGLWMIVILQVIILVLVLLQVVQTGGAASTPWDAIVIGALSLALLAITLIRMKRGNENIGGVAAETPAAETPEEARDKRDSGMSNRGLAALGSVLGLVFGVGIILVLTTTFGAPWWAAFLVAYSAGSLIILALLSFNRDA